MERKGESETRTASVVICQLLDSNPPRMSKRNIKGAQELMGRTGDIRKSFSA